MQNSMLSLLGFDQVTLNSLELNEDTATGDLVVVVVDVDSVVVIFIVVVVVVVVDLLALVVSVWVAVSVVVETCSAALKSIGLLLTYLNV